MTTAKNVGRINVWPTYDAAREVDTEESEFVGRLTVYRTNAEARANLPSEGGGGLDWVPANAVIHIDLERAFNSLDAAWTVVDGIVAVDTLLGSDANTENAYGVSEYDEQYLTVDGYERPVSPYTTPALVGGARTLLLAGATMVARYRYQLGASEGEFQASFIFIVPSADGDDSIEVDAAWNDSTVYGYSGGGSATITMPAVINGSAENPTALNCIALTLTSTRLEIAANGSSPSSAVLDGTDRPPGNPLVAATVDCPALQSITLYDALPSTTGLSELSEVA
jgi:hypothetical protein